MLKEILKIHAARYPLMQPTDAVKLIYQNEFGVGHLISDERMFADWLLRERAEAIVYPGIPLTEPIGNGLIRVMLNSPKSALLDLEQLCGACFQTASEHQGTMEKFQEKLNILTNCCESGMFGFSPEALRAYLLPYRASGCPAVSHSAAYHDTYHPAYRVVKESLFPVSE